jgi:hypothetical protein
MPAYGHLLSSACQSERPLSLFDQTRAANAAHAMRQRPLLFSFSRRSAKAQHAGTGGLLRLGNPEGAANNTHSFSATQSATPSTFGVHERKPRNALRTLLLLDKIWCCRRGLNSRPLPYQQQGAEPPETPWSNVLLWLAFSEPVSASTVKYRRVPLKPEISATPALPGAFSTAFGTKQSKCPTRLVEIDP